MYHLHMVERERDQLLLPHQLQERLRNAVKMAGLTAAIGKLRLEHDRRRTLLQELDFATERKFPDEAAIIRAAVADKQSVAQEMDAWEQFEANDPSVFDAATVLAYVSHLEVYSPTLFPKAFDFFCNRIKEEQDREKVGAATTVAINAVRSRHMNDKQRYVDILQRLLKTDGVK